jgi:hypothetical protein
VESFRSIGHMDWGWPLHLLYALSATKVGWSVSTAIMMFYGDPISVEGSEVTEALQLAKSLVLAKG